MKTLWEVFLLREGQQVAKLSSGIFLQKTAVAVTHFMAVRQEAVLSLEPWNKMSSRESIKERTATVKWQQQKHCWK